jgi:ATP-dependent DNA helicase HFM1/MER3
VVLGFYCASKTSDYCFDLSLNYKLAGIIKEYSNSKPSLIVSFEFIMLLNKFTCHSTSFFFFKFCSTRKSTQQAAQILAKTNKFFRDAQHKHVLSQAKLNDPKLRELVVGFGIGYHHAGLDSADRHTIENLFLNGDLLVLCN